MRITRAIFVTAVSLLACAPFVAGCGDDDELLERHLKRRVNINDVLGKWQMTEASRGLLIRDGHVDVPNKPYTIEFLGDGWVKFESVVDDVKGGTPTKCLGRWFLDYDVVVESKKRPNIVELQLQRPQDRYFKKLSVTEEEGNLRLWSVYGDPKFMEFIEYERPGAKPKPLTW